MSVSRTLTVAEQDDAFLKSSVAVNPTAVVPNGKKVGASVVIATFWSH
jgi:hypothetical protein